MRLLSFLLCISIVATVLSCQRASKDDVSLIPSADESSPNGLSTLPAEPHSIADETKSTSQVARSATTDATPKAIDSTRGDVVFSLLTSQVWSNRPSDQKHPFGMCPVGEGDSEFRFMADGTYEHRWIPLAGGETVVRAKGRWNLQLGHDKMWIACLDNGERHVVTLLEGEASAWTALNTHRPSWIHPPQNHFTNCQPFRCRRKSSKGIQSLVRAFGIEPMTSTSIDFQRR